MRTTAHPRGPRQWAIVCSVGLWAMTSAGAAAAQDTPRAGVLPAGTTPVMDGTAEATLTAGPGAADARSELLELRVGARATALQNTGFVADPNGLEAPDSARLESRLRMRLGLDTGEALGSVKLIGALGIDGLVGTFQGAPAAAGDSLPGERYDNALLQDAWLGFELGDRLVGLRVGAMTSQWGMGLVAHSGDDLLDGRFGRRYFELPTSGDRMLRALLYARPFGTTTGALRGLVLAAAVDQVMDDDFAPKDQGDEARQIVGSARFYLAPDQWLGGYYVHRTQDIPVAGGAPERFLDIHVFDVAWDVHFGPKDNRLSFQGELVAGFGETSLAPSPEHPEHEVRQMAVVARTGYDRASWRSRFELDLGYFSGDANFDDERLGRFVTDQNFQQGILLFRQNMAWYTGRARVTATNPLVTGYPPEDLDRLATDGAVTSAVTVFPKVGYHVHDQVEFYLGGLFAWTPTAIGDPFTTRTEGGGEARNPLGAEPDGFYLGTEIDVGARLHVPIDGMGLSAWVVAEYGVLFTGSALVDAQGDTETVHGGRLSLALTPLFDDNGRPARLGGAR